MMQSGLKHVLTLGCLFSFKQTKIWDKIKISSAKNASRAIFSTANWSSNNWDTRACLVIERPFWCLDLSDDDLIHDLAILTWRQASQNFFTPKPQLPWTNEDKMLWYTKQIIPIPIFGLVNAALKKSRQIFVLILRLFLQLTFRLIWSSHLCDRMFWSKLFD